MPKMDLTALQSLLASQRANALSGMADSTLANERSDAMDYYLGNMDKDMPAQEGRSKAVSMDVADAVEGILPNLMDIFFGSDEVVRFEPQGPEDEDAAQQETDYVNYVFVQQNDGFKITYNFFKDALLQKNGFVKVFWEQDENEERETYYDLSEDQYAALAMAVEMSDGAMEIIEHTENGDGEAAEPKEEAEVN